MSLRIRIIASLSLLAFTFVVLTMLLLAAKEPSLRTDARDSNAYLVQSLSQQIDRMMAERYREVQQIQQNRNAQNPGYWHNFSDSNPLTADINHAVATSDMIALSMLVSSRGDVLAVNSKDAHGKSLDTASLRKQNFSERRWFNDANDARFLKGSNGLSGSVVVGPYNEKAVANVVGGDGLVIAFSTQALNRSGRQIGVWVNFVPFARVEQILLSGYDALMARGIDGGELLLLDSRGIVLADITAANHQDYSHDYDIIGKLNLAEAGVKTAEEVLKTKKPGTATTRTDNGTQIENYYYSSGAGDYPGLGWTVLVRTPKHALFAHINQTINILYLFLLLMFAGLVALAIWRGERLMQRIAAPMTTVKQQAAVFEAATGALIADAVTATHSLRSDTEQLTSRMQNTQLDATKMTESANATAKRATDATSMAEAIDGALWKLAAQVKKTHSAATEANEVSTRSGKSLQTLGERASQISEALQAMAAITSQLHLLALNATIESARGDNGGFTTVAGELKSLATHTAKATEALTQKLARFEEAAQDATTDIGAIQDAVYDIAKTAESTQSGIERQQTSLTELIGGLKQVAADIAMIAQSIVTVEMHATEGASASERTQRTATTLKDQLTSTKEKLDMLLGAVRAA